MFSQRAAVNRNQLGGADGRSAEVGGRRMKRIALFCEAMLAVLAACDSSTAPRSRQRDPYAVFVLIDSLQTSSLGEWYYDPADTSGYWTNIGYLGDTSRF